MTLALIGLVILVGIAVALQGQFMGTMDRIAGTRTSMFITYGTGALIAAALWFPKRSAADALRPIPWYAWTAGALGLVIVGSIGYAAPRLGLSRTLVITVAAQLLAAVVIDHLGLFGAQQRAVDLGRAVGLAVTVLGTWLVVRS